RLVEKRKGKREIRFTKTIYDLRKQSSGQLAKPFRSKMACGEETGKVEKRKYKTAKRLLYLEV
ncbi:MAG: hypothetical protein DRP93_08840, partial [Candidatus Neomarinimicrobiota bacterium]